MSSYETALAADPEVARLLGEELNRQQTTLQLIASENFTSPAVLAASGSVLTNKYSEGYPGRRYYGGNRIIDEVEDLARARATALFGAEHANVQPHAGANANLAAYQALVEPGATDPGHAARPRRPPDPRVARLHRLEVLALRLLRRHARSRTDEADPGEVIDFDQVAHLAKTEKPALIVAGSTAYARVIDPRPFREIADSVGRALHVRRRASGRPHRRRRAPEPGRHGRRRHAHHPQDAARPPRRRHPVRGRPGQEDRQRRVPRPPGRPARARDRGQGGRLRRGGARPSSASYAAQVVANAGALADALWPGTGFRLVSGGTDNHMLLVDLRPFDAELTGKEAQEVLDRAGITCNRNTIPDDPRSPFLTSGLRLGTAAETTAGMGTGRDADGRRPHRAHAQGPRPTRARSPPCAPRSPRCAPPSRRTPTSWASACPTSAGTAWSW